MSCRLSMVTQLILDVAYECVNARTSGKLEDVDLINLV